VTDTSSLVLTFDVGTTGCKTCPSTGKCELQVVNHHVSEGGTTQVSLPFTYRGMEVERFDPFFDRDLNNFRLLFELRAISVGIIITKSDHLREIMEQLGIWSKYGTSTTWMGKLLPRIEGGGGGGCPILVFGITKKLYMKD